MSGQSAGMQIPNQNMSAPQPQSFNQQYGQQQNMGGDIYPRYGQFQNQQQTQQPMQPMQPMQQPNNGLLQTFGGGQLGYRQPMQPQMQQPVQQPAPSLLNQQMPTMQQAPMQQPVNALLPAMPTPPLRPNTPQPTFTPSPDMPFGGVGGRPFASQQTPEDYQRMQDYYAQDARDQAEMVRRMQERMGGVQPLLPNMSAPVTQSLPTTTAPKPAPNPGFTAPIIQQTTGVPNPDRNPNWQWGNTGGPRTVPMPPAPKPAPKPAFNRTMAAKARK